MQYMNRWEPNEPYETYETYETYVQAWIRYHRAADAVDGNIVSSRDSMEARLVRIAVSAGNDAMNRYLSSVGCRRPDGYDDKESLRVWNSAKMDALRRLGK